MSKSIRASVLVLLLACSAQAGIMQNDVKQPPPPPPNGIIHTGEPDGLAETVLSVLESLLALF